MNEVIHIIHILSPYWVALTWWINNRVYEIKYIKVQFFHQKYNWLTT